MERKFITTKEIEQIIISLKTETSDAYDELFTNIPKIRSTLIHSPLNYI
jgi:hypothetical protein